MQFKLFSQKLEYWVKHDQTKTLGELIDVFGEKSFGVYFLITMSLPALPIPTGGITSIVLLTTMIAAMQMIFGRRTLWIPNLLRKQDLDGKLATKALPFILARIKSVEKISRPRMKGFLNSAVVRSITGILILFLAFAALIAPPFTGLDTLPSLGGVFIALAIIFEDLAMALAGLVIGAAGVALLFAASSAVVLFFQAIF